jgi:glycerol-3-phosphate cytidylyltransferase
MALGDELIIGCATDEFAGQHGAHCEVGFERRKKMLDHCRYVDRVVTFNDVEQIRTDIINYNASLIIIGHEGYGLLVELQNIAQICQIDGTLPGEILKRRAG